MSQNSGTTYVLFDTEKDFLTVLDSVAPTCYKGMPIDECPFTAHLGCDCGYHIPMMWNNLTKKYEYSIINA